MGFRILIAKALHRVKGGSENTFCRWPFCPICQSWHVYDAETTFRGACGHLWDSTAETRCERCALMRELASYRWPEHKP